MLCHRLAAENHSLKRNMGVYIAEAQRAKRTLQHSRAAQAEYMVHDQHDVCSEYPQPPHLNQQHAWEQRNQSSASCNTFKHGRSPEQQAQGCDPPRHQSLPEFSNTTDQPYDSAEEGCSLGDKLKLMSQHEGGFRHREGSVTCPAQLPGESTEGMGMDDAKRSGIAATLELAAAEASFSLPSFNGSFHKLSDLQSSQPQCSVGRNAAPHSQTNDAQTDEQVRSHVKQTLQNLYESHLKEEHSDRAVQQSRSCETAERGTMCDHAANVSDSRYRKEASPVAAKFAFARNASIEVD